MSESHPHSSGIEEQKGHHGAFNGDLERGLEDTPRSAGSVDRLHGPEGAPENPGPRQSPPSSQLVAPSPSALPLHLIPLLPQKTPSSKRERRSIGLPSTQTDDDASRPGSLPSATGGTGPSPQSLRLRLQNSSTESAGISRTLAYAMDQMDATHSPDYSPPGGAELEKLWAGEADREGDTVTRPKTVRFEGNTHQPVNLAERLWTDAVQAAATVRMHEESEQKKESEAQNEQDEGVTCGKDTTVDKKSTAGGKREMVSEGDVQSFFRKLGAVTLGEAEERQNKDATWEMDTKVPCATTEGGSRKVDPGVGWRVEDAGSEAERATLVLKQLQEYARLKEREAELRNAEAEIRIFEERLEAREKDLVNRLGTVRQRLEAIRQRRASINRQEETLRQKMEAVTKEAKGSASVLGADAPPESS
ncbi:hypothetical protein H4582DRAFT_2053873 [Lactarius indigo]|nr:hypothetical protein H4582DRAFT_2053873 [Lactarius indigo]